MKFGWEKKRKKGGKGGGVSFCPGEINSAYCKQKAYSRQGIQRFVVTFGLKSEKGKGAEGAP